MVDKTKETAEPTIDVAALASQISQMVKGDLESEKKAAEDARIAAEKEAAKVEATATTAAERIIKDLRTELEAKDATMAEALNGIRDSLKEQAENGELAKAFAAENGESKMRYAGEQKSTIKTFDQDARDGMLYASKVFGCDVTDTKTFKEMVKNILASHISSNFKAYSHI